MELEQAMEKQGFKFYRAALRERSRRENETGKIWEVYRRGERYFLRLYWTERRAV